MSKKETVHIVTENCYWRGQYCDSCGYQIIGLLHTILYKDRTYKRVCSGCREKEEEG